MKSAKEFATWGEADRKEKERWTPEVDLERARASDVAERLLEEAQLLPVTIATMRLLHQMWDLEGDRYFMARASDRI